MRSRVDAILCRFALAVVVLVTSIPHHALAAADERVVSSATPDADEIARAIEALKSDQNLTPDRKVKTLQWVGPHEQPSPVSVSWLRWIIGLVAWIAESARRLVWLAGAALATVVVIYLIRLTNRRRARAADGFVAAPTHVQNLDIRPESLPADIAGAVRALWDAGDHRGALALLYRAMLSRLIHVHAVPIRDSSTEGDCVALAATHLAPERRDYATRLIRVWQRLVYGGEAISTPIVYALCGDFSAVLDSASPVTPPAYPGAA